MKTFVVWDKYKDGKTEEVFGQFEDFDQEKSFKAASQFKETFHPNGRIQAFDVESNMIREENMLCVLTYKVIKLT